MGSMHTRQTANTGTHRRPISAQHDWDWEYTGAIFMCPECGYQFDQPPYDHEICMACGADFWMEEGQGRP
jgi:predicted RNA-binding Zn-ribbon protein involved in translation (DUF1610 family)